MGQPVFESCINPQVSSKWVRYQVMKARISRFFKTDANLRHVEHYAKHCSIGDWFVLSARREHQQEALLHLPGQADRDSDPGRLFSSYKKMVKVKVKARL